MLNKYKEWIDKNYPTRESAVTNCHYACEKMKEVFPELKIVAGWINGAEHWWCKDPNGEVVDPTFAQYQLNNPRYREFKPGDSVRVGKCMECGNDIYQEVQELEGPRVNFCDAECEGIYARAWEREMREEELRRK